MKTKKRFLSILLSFVMVLGLMPGMSLTAYAEEQTLTLDVYDNSVEDPDRNNYMTRYCSGDDVAIAEGTVVTFVIQDRENTINIYINNEVVFSGHSTSIWDLANYSFTAGKDCKVLGKPMFSEQNRNIYITHTTHTHSFTYSASGATITATCGATGCGLTDSKATLTLAAPTLTTYGGTGDAAATLDADALTAFNTATGKSIAATDIKYYKATKSGSTYTKGDEITTGAPTDAGDYLAEITLSGVKTGAETTGDVIASVGYTIAPITISSVAVADITAPVATETLDTAATTSTEHVTLADSGAITWDPAAPQDGKAVYATTYKATVTATAAANYAFADNSTATVNGQAATVAKNQDGTLSISYTFDKTALTPVTITPADKEVTYSADGIAIPVDGMFTITEGAGAATYTVTNDTGEGTYNAETGKLTVTKCGTFTVKVSTAATATHAAGAETSATLTVKKANAVPATVAANNRTYDGTEQPLVTVTGETTGGTLKFAVTTENQEPASDAYSFDNTSIPAKTNAGTYYVWYKVVGDGSHSDAGAVCVPVTIKENTETAPSQETPTPATAATEVLPSEQQMEELILGMTTDADVNGSTFYKLQARQKRVTKKTITLTWVRADGASGYTIYGGLCGRKMTKLATVSGTSYTQKKLKPGKQYKFIVVATGGGKAVATSKTVYVCTSGGKTGNPVSVSVNKKSVKLKGKKSFRLNASVNKNKTVKKHSRKCYESTNPAVAKVDRNGKIKAVAKGKCYVYVYAQNGMFKRVKVTVK